MKSFMVMFMAVAMIAASVQVAAEEEPLKIGMIGLDTSHVIAFAKVLHNTDDPNHVPGGRVVAAYKGGSPDLESSASRVDGYTEQLQKESA